MRESLRPGAAEENGRENDMNLWTTELHLDVSIFPELVRIHLGEGQCTAPFLLDLWNLPKLKSALHPTQLSDSHCAANSFNS